MAFLTSNNVVHVYPTAFRGVSNAGKLIDPEAQLATEANLTGVISHLVGKDSFVIEYNKSSANKTMKFCVGGYYFECNLASLSQVINMRDLYVNLCTKPRATIDPYDSSTNTGYQYVSIAPLIEEAENAVSIDTEFPNLDENNTFTGIFFSDEAITSVSGGTAYSLHLLDSNGNVPAESFYKFDIRSMYIPNGLFDGQTSERGLVDLINDLITLLYTNGFDSEDNLGPDYDIETSNILPTLVPIPSLNIKEGVVNKENTGEMTLTIKPVLEYGTEDPENHTFINEPFEGMLYIKIEE